MIRLQTGMAHRNGMYGRKRDDTSTISRLLEFYCIAKTEIHTAFLPTPGNMTHSIFCL